MNDAWILSAKRTPIGKFLGAFADTPPADLGAAAARAALDACGAKPESVDEVIFGCARQAGNGPNIARQIVRRSGLPDAVPAVTINKACASGLKAIALARQSIALGEADLILAGGTESMSRVPFLLDRSRTGYRLGHAEAVDAMYRDGFLCPLCGDLMGKTAERLAHQYQINREEQDRFAAESQQRCESARKAGRFKDELVPTTAARPGKAGVPVDADEHPRDGVTADSLAKLPPVFDPKGTVHAGNSSGIVDGAAAVVVASTAKMKELGAAPLARIVGSTVAGVDPAVMGIGPVPALRRLEEKTGWRLDDIDLIELNEAFAAQVLACDRELHFDRSRLNVNGGAIALGHPIGATGTRVVVTLLHEMKRRGVRRGLATLCVSGGMGMAMAFERG
ncbi:MAG: acetyl-CoA C-acyltransferase [Planctomycetes bacterium]|nr:acetyl-CoA C-acyltransferase [Planctomycetota bacterium]